MNGERGNSLGQKPDCTGVHRAPPMALAAA